MTGKQVLIFIFCASVLVTCECCKKGCTDKAALNYSHAAKADDGECLYCDSAYRTIDYEPMGVWDDSSGSPFEGQLILLAYFESKGNLYTGNGCQKYNFPGYGSCIPVSHYGGLINQINKTVVLTGTINIVYASGQQINYNFNSQVAPFDTLSVGNVGSLCILANDSAFEWWFPQGYSIQYK